MLAVMTTTPAPRPGREAGKRRIRDVTTWTLAGALSATGLFAGLASAHRATTTSTTTKATAAQSTTSDSSGSSASSATSSDDDNSSSSTSSHQTQLQPTTVQPSNSGSASVTSGAS